MQSKLFYFFYVRLLLVTVVTPKLSKHTAYRPTSCHCFLYRDAKKYHTKLGELSGNAIFLRIAGSLISVRILCKQHELYRTVPHFNQSLTMQKNKATIFPSPYWMRVLKTAIRKSGINL